MTGATPGTAEPLRFADILTTGSAVANYLGEATVIAQHLLAGIAILKGEMTLEDLGRAISPLVRRTPPGIGSAVDPPIRELAQRWFAALGSDADATMSAPQLEQLIFDLERLRRDAEGSRVPPD